MIKMRAWRHSATVASIWMLSWLNPAESWFYRMWIKTAETGDTARFGKCPPSLLPRGTGTSAKHEHFRELCALLPTCLQPCKCHDTQKDAKAESWRMLGFSGKQLSTLLVQSWGSFCVISQSMLLTNSSLNKSNSDRTYYNLGTTSSAK